VRKSVLRWAFDEDHEGHHGATLTLAERLRRTRECLDHMVIFNERDLRSVLSSSVNYYYQRTPARIFRSPRIVLTPLHHAIQDRKNGRRPAGRWLASPL
jgi:hypothetical protein